MIFSMNDDRYTRITLRIPKALHERLALAADDASHSMNAEIISRLEESFLSTKDGLAPDVEAQLAVVRRAFERQLDDTLAAIKSRLRD